MRFIVRQKVFAFGDQFTIRDEAGADRFTVKGKIFALGNKLRLFDMDGKEVVYIEQKLFRFLPEYTIYYQEQPAAVVKKAFSLLKPRFHIASIHGDFTVEGNIWAMEFVILKDGRNVAQVSKRWFAWADTYGVETADSEEIPFILALVIVIDQVLHDSNNNHA